jgi:hypothetical protein
VWCVVGGLYRRVCGGEIVWAVDEGELDCMRQRRDV